MTALRHLRFDEIAPGRDFHAALVTDLPRRADVSRHAQDFPELMYALDGDGAHEVNGGSRPLRAGDLCWVRSADCHALTARPGHALHFINVAFRPTVWADFRRFALGPSQTAWEDGADPPVVSVPAPQRAACAALFRDTLRAFYGRPTRLDLCRLWAGTLPLLCPPAPEAAGGASANEETGPAWLARACLCLESDDALRVGVPRLCEIAGVSPAYLSRTLKAQTGQTPTEWVNARRLDRAAVLLATTPDEIADIAEDCGFQNLSYFYRRFRQRFGHAPRAYRLAARLAVVP